jgi:hypothetical protein
MVKKSSLIATLMSVLTRYGSMIYIMHMHQQYDALHNRLVQTELKVDVCEFKVAELEQRLSEKTILGDIYNELDRVYDHVYDQASSIVSFITTIATTTTTNINNNDDEYDDDEYYEGELAPPEPPNNHNRDSALLAARSYSTGSSPPQGPSSIQEQSSSVTTAVAAAMSSMFSMVRRPNALFGHVVDLVVNGPSTIRSWCDLASAHYNHFKYQYVIDPTISYLEEQWGVSPFTSTYVFLSVAMVFWWLCFIWSFGGLLWDTSLYGSLHRIMTLSAATLRPLVDLLHQPLSAIYMRGTVVCCDLYKRANRLLGRVTERALLIRQAETVTDNASKHGWVHAVDSFAFDPRRYEAIRQAYDGIDLLLDTCLMVLDLPYTAKIQDLTDKLNLLLERARDAQGTESKIRFTRRMINKLRRLVNNRSLTVDEQPSVANLTTQLKTSYAKVLKTCPIQAIPLVLLRLQPYWPEMAWREYANLERLEDSLRASCMAQAKSEMGHFMERVQVIYGIDDLNSASERHIHKLRNKLRRVHHPDKGGRREHYEFLDKTFDHLHEHWFQHGGPDSSLGGLTLAYALGLISIVQSSRISELPGLLAGMRLLLAIPSEIEHLQLSTYVREPKQERTPTRGDEDARSPVRHLEQGAS